MVYLSHKKKKERGTQKKKKMKVALWNKKDKEFEFVENVEMVIPQTTIIVIWLDGESRIEFSTDDYSLESVWIQRNS